MDEQEKILRNIRGGIWATNPITTDPVVTLVKWSVFRVPSPNGDPRGDCHFNGYNTGDQEGRVSSKIMAFDQETMVGTTRSGRKYQLMDEPGYDGDAAYVRDYWLRINKVAEDDVTDATGEFLTREQKKELRPNNPELWDDDIQSSNTSKI